MNNDQLYDRIASHHPLPEEELVARCARFRKQAWVCFAVFGCSAVLLALWMILVDTGVILVGPDARFWVACALAAVLLLLAAPATFAAADRVEKAGLILERASTEQLEAATELASEDTRYAAVLRRWLASTGELRESDYDVLRPAVHEARRVRAHQALTQLTQSAADAAG